ncbi:glycosyltransferase family 2 protein [Nocardioides glacieisoli]|uniref:Glycosyltransferase family 2 protein n=1 Tax=Nocardioides glacieisoli TaxID=1168730 RepID=A0A4Q2RUI1_9ACTN|nr:glycosyltransferase family 2 protein [Nocardioides glacieisoli]RYB91479.1 glycosyltransferase family 2 protein [Nocardioides glacieisoli]
MSVTALLVSHDGARWLPAVLAGLIGQTLPVDRVVAVDTTSRDESVELVENAFSSAGPDHRVPDLVLDVVHGSTSYPAAVRHGLGLAPTTGPDEWVWLLHDDSNPDPAALAELLAAAEAHPTAAILGPKLREWPSLRRLLEVGLTITGTGRRETGLERGEYDQGQHDEVREVLAVNTAGMLVRREVLEALGGLDEDLPIFGNDIDFGWRAALAGHRTIVVPQAVVFHAEAAHRGIRRTPLTGRHTHYQERRAALLTSLANVSGRSFAWHYVRLFLGSILRVLGFFAVRAVGEGFDELAAVLSVHGRPGQVLAARRERARRREGEPSDVRHLLAPAWLPYRHGLDFVADLGSALTGQAADVAERRRAARTPDQAAAAQQRRSPSGSGEDDEEAYLTDSGLVARFFTNPVAVVLVLFGVLALVAAHEAFGTIVGGALSPVPAAASDWWSLHVSTWLPLGTGTDVPAPAYVLPFAMAAWLMFGHTGAVVSALMLLAVPFAAWGAWRLLAVVGRLVDPLGLPRWLVVWGALTYALVPVSSGAWAEGRFGTVAVAALLPWAAHAALGFVDPDRDRRWRAAWRTALLLALGAAFVPGLWLFALLSTAVVLGAAAVISPRLLKERDSWGPPVVAVAATPVLLAPWLVPLVTTGSASGLLLEAGRITVDQVTFGGLLTGRLNDLGAPAWLGAVLVALALAALAPRRTRVPVVICWIVALAAAVVSGVLSHVSLDLPSVTTRPSLGLFVVILQGTSIVAAVLGADAYLRRLDEHHPWWQRGLATALAVVAAAVPLGGLGWWLTTPGNALARDAETSVPVYMEQSSLLGQEHGVLVVSGSVEDGITYRIRRDDGTTVGEDEVLTLAAEDTALTDDVRTLVSSPTPAVVAELGDRGVEYVVLTSPADGQVSSLLDATAGLDQASAEDRSTRAWRVDRPLDPASLDRPRSWWRTGLLVLQGLAVLAALVLAAPTVRQRREEQPDA